MSRFHLLPCSCVRVIFVLLHLVFSVLSRVARQIACLKEDVRPGLTTHRELDPTNMLSLVASLTPFSDYNQSPRNMYQVWVRWGVSCMAPCCCTLV